MQTFRSLLALPALFLLGSLAYAEGDVQRSIQVQGQGEIKVSPNMATLQFAVETQAADAKKAVADNASQMNHLVSTLKKEVGEEGSVSTTRFNLTPTYEYDKDTRRSIPSGYQVTNYVMVSTRKIDKLGELLDSGTKAGASRIENLQLTHDKWHSYEQQALAQAVLDAKQTASILAKAADVKLGELVTLQPSMGGGVVPMRDFALAKAGTPIEPGDLTVSMSVSASYAID